MPSYIKLLLVLVSMCASQAKFVAGTFTPAQFFAHKQFFYLGKMDYGVGSGNLNVTLTLEGPPLNDSHRHLFVGILIDEKL